MPSPVDASKRTDKKSICLKAKYQPAQNVKQGVALVANSLNFDPSFISRIGPEIFELTLLTLGQHPISQKSLRVTTTDSP